METILLAVLIVIFTIFIALVIYAIFKPAKPRSQVLIEVFCVATDGVSVSGYPPLYTRHRLNSDPMDAARNLVTSQYGIPTVLHGTSWRVRKDGKICLSFLAVMHSLPSTAEILPYEADTQPHPHDISVEQVRSHALRHLAHLLEHDTYIQTNLNTQQWQKALKNISPDVARYFQTETA